MRHNLLHLPLGLRIQYALSKKQNVSRVLSLANLNLFLKLFLFLLNLLFMAEMQEDGKEILIIKAQAVLQIPQGC
jgi:hypothetical protein